MDAGAGEEIKGQRTRAAILERAVEVACRVGLGGLTVGQLAAEAGLSKSGLYARVRSKEALQLAVLETAAEQFAAAVVRPALQAPRGEPRVHALVDRWLACGRTFAPGGVLIVKASVELDDQEGAVRDLLEEQHRELVRTIARIFAGGVADGQFRVDAAPDQFAADLYGVMLAYYHAHRLLRDPRAEARARTAVAALLTAARSPHHPGVVRAPDEDAPSGASHDEE